MAYKFMLAFVLILVIVSEIKSDTVLNSGNSHGRILSSVRRSLQEDPKNVATNSMDESLSVDQTSLDSINCLDRSGFNAMQRRAIDDCQELLQRTSDLVTECLWKMKSYTGKYLKQNQMVYMQTWVSATLTNQDTCLESLKEANISLKNFSLAKSVSNTWRFVSKSLRLLRKMPLSNGNNPQKRIVHGNRLLEERHVHFEDDFSSHSGPIENGFPSWMSNANRRRLLQTSPNDGGISVDGILMVA